MCFSLTGCLGGRRRPVVAAMLLLLPWTVSAAETLSPDEAVALALEGNPSLAASHERARAAAEGVPQAGALPDPRLSVGLLNLPGTLALDKDPMSQVQVGISQALPFPGKRDLMARSQARQAEAARLDSESERLALVRDVKQAWWSLFYLDRAIEAVRHNRELMVQLQDSAETRYSVGRGLQQDLLMAQLAVARQDDEALRLDQSRIEALARLNTLMDRPPLTPVVLAAQKATPLPDLSDDETWQTQALAQRPDLQAQTAGVDAARARRDLSARDHYPDFTVGAGYGIRDGRENLVSVQLSMNLPLYSGRKQARAEDQRQAELITARHQLRQIQSRVAAEVAVAASQYRRARDQVKLYDGTILPQARQSVETLLAAYEVNRADFSQVMQVQTSLHEYETGYWRAYSSARQALAALAAAVGKETIDE